MSELKGQEIKVLRVRLPTGVTVSEGYRWGSLSSVAGMVAAEGFRVHSTVVTPDAEYAVVTMVKDLP